MGPIITWADIDSVPVGTIGEADLARLHAAGWATKALNFDLTFRTSWTWFHALREYVQNSLRYETPMLTLRGGQIRLESIGEVVARNLGDSAAREGPCTDGTRVLAVDFKRDVADRRLEWRAVSRVHRHPYQGDMREVRCTNGRRTTCTEGHSLFVQPGRDDRIRGLARGRVKALPPRAFLPDDPIVIPFTELFAHAPDMPSIPVFDLLARAGFALDFAGVNEWAEGVGVRLNRDERKVGRFASDKAAGLRPPSGTRFALRRGHHPIPLDIPADPVFWLLGLYAAEGCVGGKKASNAHIIFSIAAQGPKLALVDEIRARCREIGLPDAAVCVAHPHPTALNVYVYCPPLALLFRDVFLAGQGALNKRVPDVVFNGSAQQQMRYIDAFRRGDGSRSDEQKRTIYSTSGPNLRTGLEFLFTLNGIPYSVTTIPAHKAVVIGRECQIQTAWSLYVYDGGSSPLIHRRRADLTTVDLKETIPIPYTDPWVYDVSVPGCENFVAGESPFLYHNSLDGAGRADIGIDRAGPRVMTLVGDDGAGFPLNSILFGERKTSDEARRCLRGQFGEGMKLGVVPVLRSGNRVFIRTVGYDVAFVIVQYRHGGRHELEEAFALTRDNGNERGTTVALEGLDATAGQVGTKRRYDETAREYVQDPVFEDLRLRFLPFLVAAKPDVLIHSVAEDCQRRDVLAMPGVVFVRDIFVQADTSFVFGYNFWFEDLAADKPLDPNRDRFTLDSESYVLRHELARIVLSMPDAALDTFVRGLWAATNRWATETQALRQNGTLDAGGAKFAQRLFAVISRVVGTEKFSWATEHRTAEAAMLEYHGYKNLAERLPWAFYYLLEKHGLVKAPSRVQSAINDDHVIVIDPKRFTAAARRAAAADAGRRDGIFKAARAFGRVHATVNAIATAMLKEAYEPPVPVNFYLALGEESDACAGFTNQARVLINSGILSETYEPAPRLVLRTLAHELGHVLSGAGDGTTKFEHGFARATGVIMGWAHANTRAYNAIFRDVGSIVSYANAILPHVGAVAAAERVGSL